MLHVVNYVIGLYGVLLGPVSLDSFCHNSLCYCTRMFDAVSELCAFVVESYGKANFSG